MVGFKNRYMVMEVFLDPSKDLGMDEPVIITQFNLSKAIKDSILTNFGECGLASSLNSFQGEVGKILLSCLVPDHTFSMKFLYISYEFEFLSSAVKYVNPITKVCIIRVSREEYQRVWAAITMVRSVGNCPVVFNLLDLSGESHFYNLFMVYLLY